jgi:hypothetical protein
MRAQHTNDHNPCLLPCIATFTIGFVSNTWLLYINMASYALRGGSHFVCGPIILVIQFGDYGQFVDIKDKV